MRARLPVRFLIFVLALPVAALHAASADPPSAAELVPRARALLNELAPDGDTRAYASTARRFGALVTSARDLRAGAPELRALLELAESLRVATRARIRAQEDAAGDDEAALERLYRSADWDVASYALAATPYWRAWIELTLAENDVPPGERIQLLHRAQRGFRAAAVRFLHSDLVFGGWLGIAYVAAAEGQRSQALTIFRKLEQALAREPDHPLRQVVRAEIDALEARPGERAPGTVAAGDLDAGTARQLRDQAFAALEQRRRTGSGGRVAASQLRRLIEAGAADAALVGDMLRYRTELLGYDLGPLGRLLDAEDAFENGHYYDAAGKYAELFRDGAALAHMDLTRFRYRQAYAYVQAGVLGDGIRVLGTVLAAPDLDPELRMAALELMWVARARRYEASGDAPARGALVDAARAYLATRPSGDNADRARLTLAQLSADAPESARALAGIRSPQVGGAQVDLTRFNLLARQFAEQIRAGSAAAAATARTALALYPRLKLSRDTRDQYAAIALQMRVAIGESSPELLRELDRLSAVASGLEMQQALFSTRLQLLDRSASPEAVAAFAGQLAAQGPQGWQVEQFYPRIARLSDPAAVATAAAALAPALGNDPAMARQLRLLGIRAQLDAGSAAEAYAGVREIVATDPSSGDAWLLYARAAALTDHPFEAERAWKIIAEHTPAGTAKWWDAMLERVEIRARSTRPEAACELLPAIEPRRATLAPAVRARLDAALGKAPCSRAENSNTSQRGVFPYRIDQQEV
ncbi:MAG: hypothetical protein IT495_22040 [Gammaproteobacteria bacterium]|nr:hypothetical protein [Gammaproteobacteria bacterium]